MNIAVFGGSGYIMRQVVKHGAKQGHKMVCVDMKAPDYTWPNQMFVKANLSTAESTKKSFGDIESTLKENGFKGGIDAVANGIAVLDYTKTVEQLYTPNVLTARYIARESAARHAFMVHLSGVAVQGITNPLPLREEYPLDPIEPYGITKALSELEVYGTMEKYGLDAIILRANAVVGPECLGTMILQMFETVRGPVVPRPSTLNSYINTIDIGKAVIFAIEKQNNFVNAALDLSDIVYNICDKEPITDGQAFEHLMKRIPPKAYMGLLPVRFKTNAPASKSILRTVGFLSEAIANLTHTKPAVPYNLSKLAHVGHAQSREKFERDFERNGFEMTFNSTYDSLDYVVRWLYENHWKEPMPDTF